MRIRAIAVSTTVLTLGFTALATSHYVDLNSPNPTPPYANWATAARVIQDAVDVASPGDEIVVTNGIYSVGGRPVSGTMLTNRVAVDKQLALRSINGPEFTIIQGYQVPGTLNGDAAVRCVYLAERASLSGFTLTNGATRNSSAMYSDLLGGGVWCSGFDSGGNVVYNCVITGNSAEIGGGAEGGTLNNCTLTGNSANGGYGLDRPYGGGGANGGILNNCTLSGNSAQFGGGASQCTLNNCTLTGNSATRNNGTGGGTFQARLNNCIVYFNTAAQGANYDTGFDSSVLNYCCTTPLPTNGIGNISVDPQLASASHLSAASPCRAAGSAAYATGTDIDGEAWRSPPSIGCDEYHPGAVTGLLSVGIAAPFTTVATGYPVALRALIGGRTTASTWDFGDGLTATNRAFETHTWALPGDYAAVLRAYNESQPSGISATVTVHVVQALHYVAAANSNPAAPYTSWGTAARNIQDAVDVAEVGGTILVTNGTYTTGGRAVLGTMTNRVTVDKPLTLRSMNGPQFTIVQGYQVPGTTNGDGAIRCVYLTNGASLFGFTLIKGATRSTGDYLGEQSGGGLWCESPSVAVFNCVVTDNSAAENGGGAFSGTLNNCILIGNEAGYSGGGAFESMLNNCTLISNEAGSICGGASGSSGFITFGTYANLNNCIVYFNTAPDGPNYDALRLSVLNYCCTTPEPANGFGNITNAPVFVDYSGGNLRLQSNSPCINAGNNACAPAGLDVDGNPRIVRGTVDIGAYEFQSPASVISYAWLQYYGLPTDGSADYADPDGDGMNDWQEWRAGTDPTNPLSVLRMLAPTGVTNMSGINVTWQNVSGISYFIERSTNLGNQPAFSLLQSNIVGQAGTTTWTDTNASGPGPFFYRVGVRN